MFRANMCPSSGATTVFMRHLVLVILCGRLSGMQEHMGVNPTAVNKCILYHISHIKWRWVCSHRSKTTPLNGRTKECHASIRFSMYLGPEVPSEDNYNDSLSLKRKLCFLNNKFLLVLVNTHNRPPPPQPPLPPSYT